MLTLLIKILVGVTLLSETSTIATPMNHQNVGDPGLQGSGDRLQSTGGLDASWRQKPPNVLWLNGGAHAKDRPSAALPGPSSSMHSDDQEQVNLEDTPLFSSREHGLLGSHLSGLDPWIGGAAHESHNLDEREQEILTFLVDELDGSSHTRRNLDEKDHEFLESVLRDLSNTRPAEFASEEVGQSSGSPLEAPAGEQFKASESGSNSHAPRNQLTRIERLDALRKALNWPEPRALRELRYIPPLKDLAKDYAIEKFEDQFVRKRINDGAFAGKLKWHNLKDVPQVGIELSRKSPARASSRQLPMVYIEPPEGSVAEQAIQVHMTDHGVTRRLAMKDRPLAGKPYYAFWGVPSRIRERSNKIYYFGAAHIEKEDNAAVDRHLQPWLELVRSAHE